MYYLTFQYSLSSLALLSIIALMLGLMLIASLAAKISDYFCSEKAVKPLNRTAGSIMMLAGGFLVTSK